MKTFKEFVTNEAYEVIKHPDYHAMKAIKKSDGTFVKTNDKVGSSHRGFGIHTSDRKQLPTIKTFDNEKDAHNYAKQIGLKNESIDEAYGDPKYPFVPTEGANVRIPTEKLGQTIGGKVLRKGRSGLWHVKAANGETHALPEKHIFHPDLSDKNYHEYSWGANAKANSAMPVREATEAEKPKLETYRVNNDHHNLAINVKAYSAKEAREHATKLNPKFGHKATTSSKSLTRE